METRPGLEKTREIKVALPKHMHVALQSRKILHGTPIHRMVTEALDEYFAKHPAPSFGDPAS